MSESQSEANERDFRKKDSGTRRWIDGSKLDFNNPELPYAPTVTANKNAKRLAPGVLEGASAFLYLCSTALLQSRNGIIKVFPGVPEDFTGSFEKLLAENAMEISAKMLNGKVAYVKIHSIYGGEYKLLNPFGKAEKYLTGHLRPGESIVIK